MTRRREQEIDLTPMIDVTLLILIFFMVTASFSMQRAIEMPVAENDNASRQVVSPERDRDPIRLHVDRHGSFLLMATDWQKELVGKQELLSELAAARVTTAMETELQIEVESAARLQALVDAMDAATLAGFHRLQLTEVDSEFI